MEVTNSIKRIVIIGPAHPYRGGIADTNEAMARAFQTMSIETHLVTFKVQYPDFLFPGKSQFSVSPPPKNLRIHRWIHSFQPINWALSARKINKLNPDVVIIRYWLPLMAPCFGSIAKMLNKKIVIIGLTDNVIPHEQRMMDKWFTRFFMASCNGFMALSKAVEQDLKSLTNLPVAQFPHPINDQLGAIVDKKTAQEKLGLQQSKFYLLFFGFIRPYKGLDLLLEAMGDPRVKAEEIELIVAGEAYESMEPYFQMTQRLGLQNKVHWFNDFIPNEEVPNFFGAADWVTQTYKTATQSGITQMALHFNKPALITKVGGLEEFVIDGETGLLCNPNPNSIANAILSIFQKGIEAAHETSIKKVKDRFSWSNFAAQFIQFISSNFTK